jgi:CheY-like chemotaxis protein
MGQNLRCFPSATTGSGGRMRGRCGTTLSVLVVEDDEAVGELLRTVLNQVPGWGATLVHDAAAATDVFRHVQVDALVVDIDLPDISGPALLNRLRREPNRDQPPAILMSAHAYASDVQDAIGRGLAVTFLSKPFDLDVLLRELEAAVSARRS